MTIKEFIITGYHDARAVFAQHKILVLIFVVLLSIGSATRFLRGDVLGGPASASSSSSSSSLESLRSCISKDTMFEDTENIGETRDIYKEAMSKVVAEREKILKTPSEWRCGIGSAGEPSIPELRNLADQLPGWHYYVTVPFVFGSAAIPVARPVTFASFGSIIAEFQREYECKLTELQDRNIAEVTRNQDIEKPAQFCCIAEGCREQDDATNCLSSLTNDPLCNSECPVAFYMSDLTSRLPAFQDELSEELQVSRVAVERTLSTLRSFDMNYAIAKQLICYQRASLDLKNEMSLLADAVSCMPKIWDAVTSIHDKKK